MKRKTHRILARTIIVLAILVALAAIILAVSSAHAEGNDGGITIVKPGSFVFVKLLTDSDDPAEVICIEFDVNGKGAIISRFDQDRILAIVEPGEQPDSDLVFHYYRNINNWINRQDFSKLMAEIDEGQLTRWDKAKAYTKGGLDWVWDKTLDLKDFIEDEVVDPLAEYGEQKGWGDKVRDFFSIGK